jgi:hypothetical protein
MGEQQAFDLDDRDVLAAADDDVLAAPDEAYSAGIVNNCGVAGAEPTVVKRPCVLLGPVVITDEQPGSPAGSVTRPRAPATGTPSVCCASRPSDGAQEIAIAYSVMPQAGQMRQPSAPPARSGSDRGTGAPATVIISSGLVSAKPEGAASARSCTNVGAQNIVVTPRSRMTSRATAGCQRSR